MRTGLLLGSLVVALIVAVLALQVPRPRGLDAPAAAFSAARAMIDVRRIARAPHPVGSAEHARVAEALLVRMSALGLTPAIQSGALSPAAIARLRSQGVPTAGLGVSNLVGVLPGRDANAPAVLLMAHYDTVPGSPGAADDSTGVAAVLETVRAIRARGPAERSLVVLLTDGEELNLDGARVFFGEHPLRDRIGAVVNLEARGGGGRAMMFETGRGNAETVRLFARAMRRADGGATSNSLAVFVYERMPNGTDFTIPKDRGVGGVNLAFIGRASQYHSPTATANALDQGAVQHIGAQALEATDALLRAPALPRAGENRVYADLLGRVFLSHPPATGWLLLGLTAALFAAAAWRARRAAGLTAADVGRGLLSGLWLLTSGVVMAQAVRVLAGPMAARAASADAYYTLLRRLPWIEAGAALAVLAVALTLMAGREAVGRRVLVGVVAVATLLALAIGGFSPIILGVGAVAAGLSLWGGAAPKTVWGGWLGLIGLVLLLGVVAQALAPEAAFLFIWTALLAALAATVAATVDPGLLRPMSLIPAAAATVLAGGWILYLAHPVFLGIGMDLPGALALMGLLVLMFARPLSPPRAHARAFAAGAAACLILACGVSLAARLAEPMPPPAAGPTEP